MCLVNVDFYLCFRQVTESQIICNYRHFLHISFFDIKFFFDIFDILGIIFWHLGS